jgi:AcrR family transcriptional regulator
LTPDERREALLDAALQLAAGSDLTLLSVRDIALHAGVSEGLLYHYFPTKDALIEAAVTRAANALTEALDEVVEGPPALALAAGLTAFLDQIERDPVGWRAVLQAHSGALADIGASVREHSRRLPGNCWASTRRAPCSRAPWTAGPPSNVTAVWRGWITRRSAGPPWRTS